MFKHKSTSGSNCFVTFILPEGALFVYQLFAEQSIILNLKQKRNPVSTKFLFCYLTEFCPSLTFFNSFIFYVVYYFVFPLHNQGFKIIFFYLFLYFSFVCIHVINLYFIFQLCLNLGSIILCSILYLDINSETSIIFSFST